jgi:hydrogenase maturation protease
MELLAGTRLEFTGVGGIALLDHLEGTEQAMIVVDAVQFGAPAGTIHRLSWDEIPAFDNAAISAHGIGLKEAVEVGRLLCPEKLPESIMLFGIEGRCFNQMREYMTPEVAAAVTDTANGIRQYLHDFQQG